MKTICQSQLGFFGHTMRRNGFKNLWLSGKAAS